MLAASGGDGGDGGDWPEKRAPWWNLTDDVPEEDEEEEEIPPSERSKADQILSNFRIGNCLRAALSFKRRANPRAHALLFRRSFHV